MMSSQETSAFLVGITTGFFLTGFCMTLFVVNPLEREAIKRGYAEWKNTDPTKQTETVFTWK